MSVKSCLMSLFCFLCFASLTLQSVLNNLLTSNKHNANPNPVQQEILWKFWLMWNIFHFYTFTPLHLYIWEKSYSFSYKSIVTWSDIWRSIFPSGLSAINGCLIKKKKRRRKLIKEWFIQNESNLMFQMQ